MCNNGRVKHHLKNIISNPNATVLFVGYAGEGTLADNLKKELNEIIIDGETYIKECKIDTLQTLSSHITYFGMTEYYTNINCNKLVLHHGDIEGKKQLKEDLEEIFYQKCQTTKVIVADKNTKIIL